MSQPHPFREGTIIAYPNDAADYHVSLSGNGFGVRAAQLEHLIASHDFGDAAQAIRQMLPGNAVAIVRGAFSLIVARPSANRATIRQTFAQ